MLIKPESSADATHEAEGRAFDVVGISVFTSLVAGVDVKIVSERLGHASPLITWQTYQRVIKGMQTDAADPTCQTRECRDRSWRINVGERRKST